MAGRNALQVLVTRAEPSASRTARLLQETGFSPICIPLFALDDTGSVLPDTEFEGYVFTSINAANVLRDRSWRCTRPNSAAYCVGKETAAAAKSLGFDMVISVDGTAKDLAERLKLDFGSEKHTLLYFAGEQRSFDLQGALAPDEIALEMVEIYRISPIQLSVEQYQKLNKTKGAAIVLLYSHITAKHVCKVLFDQTENTDFASLSAVAISAKTAEAVLKYPWQKVYVADEPNQQSMISKLNEISLA